MINLKRCTHCKEEKPSTVEFFPPSKELKCGLHSWCRVCHRKLHKKRNALNPEKNRENVRQWRLKNPEKKKEMDRLWQQNNSLKVKERNGRWVKKNLVMCRIRRMRYLARKHEADGYYTANDIKHQGDVQNWKCYWNLYGCKIDCSKQYHVDHVIPLSRGGSNWPSNIVISCPHCNQSKGNKLPNELLLGRV